MLSETERLAATTPELQANIKELRATRDHLNDRVDQLFAALYTTPAEAAPGETVQHVLDGLELLTVLADLRKADKAIVDCYLQLTRNLRAKLRTL